MAQNLSSQRAMSNYKAGTRSGRQVNDVAPHNSAKSTHNVFPMSYPHAQTARYGEIAPFFSFNAQARDVVPLQSSFNLRTLALISPKMTPLFMKRSYYEVKHNAILPRSFEYIFKNPLQGDDVPEDAYCNFNTTSSIQKTFTESLKNIVFQAFTLLSQEWSSDAFISILRSVLLLESIYSDGSLLSSLCCPLSGYVRDDFNKSVDFDGVVSDFYKLLFLSDIPVVPVFIFDELTHVVNGNESISQFAVLGSDASSFPRPVISVSINRMLELLRSYTPSSVSLYSLETGESLDESSSEYQVFILSLFQNSKVTNYKYFLPVDGIDVSRVVAYQLVCAEWYTNDKVDYIYNADLWRKSMDFFVKSVLRSVDFFDYNDIGVMYDALSSHNFYAMHEKVNELVVNNFAGYVGSDIFTSWFDYLSNLFFFNRSLKFEDYFSGARTQPLAQGNNSISDTSDPIEVVRGIQLTRFLNAVNRSGLDEKYLQEIFSTVPAASDLIPKWIETYEDRIDQFEVNNTAQDQGKITSALNSTPSDDHKYTAVEVDGYPSIILGLYSFDMPRAYVQAIDKDFFTKDRYDMFNPYFQYDGDQAITRSELYPVLSEEANTNFAYTGRDNHRKMRIPRASGGFVKWLPGWLFTIDDPSLGVPYSHLNPEYILSSSCEFDSFFDGFPAYSLDGYFHFIINFVNSCDAVRAMEFNPAILNG